MLLFLLPRALALDPFTCDPLATPADGVAYADVGTRSRGVFDTLVGVIRAEFEPGCPRMCDTGMWGVPPGSCYQDDCVNTAGTYLQVDYRHDTGSGFDEEVWDVTVEPAGGPYTSVTLASESVASSARGGGHGYDGSLDWTWSASWVGAPDTGLPADGALGVTLTSEVSYDDAYDWYWSRVTESWDDGVCAWDATESHTYWPTLDAYASWSIHVGAQALEVSEASDACAGLVREAMLDGVTSWVVDPDWAPIVDADGDGAEVSVDCDDADAAVYPCAEDVPNDGVDQDCDGGDTVDVDLDGYHPGTGSRADCDDADASVYPGAPEALCDGIDQDCDGADLGDADGDGHAAACAGGDDGDDADAAVYPGARDAPDGVDTNCDGLDGVDADRDGHVNVPSGGLDCDDRDAGVHPDATDEPYDGVDQDCSGADLDDVDADGFVGDEAGGDDCDDVDGGVNPGAREAACDGVDQDCDGFDLCEEGPDEPPREAHAEEGCGGSGGCGGGAALLMVGMALGGRRRG